MPAKTHTTVASTNNAATFLSIQEEGIQNEFSKNFDLHLPIIETIFYTLYPKNERAEKAFEQLVEKIKTNYENRSAKLKKLDKKKSASPIRWYLSNQITGMSLYVDRFSENIRSLENRLTYFEEIGVNLLHLMPLFESPESASDGGYAVSDFRKINQKFGNLADLKSLRLAMLKKNLYLMLDIVLNHTSDQHQWAKKALEGDPYYQDFYYFFDDYNEVIEWEHNLPEIFPTAAPGNFTYIPSLNKWVMTVFHNYQWDLNFSNPYVFVEMLDTILFYANLGVDILRIDAPAFIWKRKGTSSQNLPEAHLILRLIRQCVDVAAPGLAILGEAIVDPDNIMKYFGTGEFEGRECHFAYNATQMALQWDMLATGDTRTMLNAQSILLSKPYETSWITYIRCHDDIGLGYTDASIQAAGFSPYDHRAFIKNFYTGQYPDSFATGALFSQNSKTGDGRISGTLASLCGLEKAMIDEDSKIIQLAIQRIILMQAFSLFLGGIPMLFYGDEIGYTNDYSFLKDPSKHYDNRWMHRPLIDWTKNENRKSAGATENQIFTQTKDLIQLRKNLPLVADLKNIIWLTPHNIHVAIYVRHSEEKKLFCVFNFSADPAYLTWYFLRELGDNPKKVADKWTNQMHSVGADNEYLILYPYQFCFFEVATTT